MKVVACALAGALVLEAGCGAQRRSLASENELLSSRLAAARAESRRNRRKIRDLETELLVARTDGQMTASEPAAARDDQPRLPVVVREPEPGALPPESEPLSADGPIEYAGVGDDGTEVLYVGDAAVAPPAEPRISDSPRRRRAAHPRVVEPVPEIVDHATDRIAVTDVAPLPSSASPSRSTDLGPTRRARQAGVRARSRRFDDVRAEYERYQAALAAGDHAGAVAGFRNLVERFPDDDYADNAQYWLGEAFYDQKQFKTALAEFKRVVDNYPTANKVPDALLKLAYCHAQLGDRKSARVALRRLIRDYPASNPAALALVKLAELGD